MKHFFYKEDLKNSLITHQEDYSMTKNSFVVCSCGITFALHLCEVYP